MHSNHQLPPLPTRLRPPLDPLDPLFDPVLRFPDPLFNGLGLRFVDPPFPLPIKWWWKVILYPYQKSGLKRYPNYSEKGKISLSYKIHWIRFFQLQLSLLFHLDNCYTCLAWDYRHLHFAASFFSFHWKMYSAHSDEIR